MRIQNEYKYISAWITPQTKKFTDTKSLGITRPYLVRQPANTPLICQLRGDITMGFRRDHALKQLVHGFSSFHFDMPLGSASTPYLVELGSRELTYTKFTTQKKKLYNPMLLK